MKPQFSFIYNGETITQDLLKGVTKGNETEYVLPDGVKLTVKAEYYPEYNVSKWTNYWENPTDHRSGIITELRDCDIRVPFEKDTKESGKVIFYVTTGANVNVEDHWITPHEMEIGQHEYRHCEAGRPAYGVAPFFEFGRGDRGALVAVGWTGQWESMFDRYEDSFRMRAGVQDVSLSMLPGEHFRTSSVTVLEYENGRENGRNTWRRYMRDVVSPFAKSNGRRGTQCPFSAIFWGGVTSEQLLRRWKAIFDTGFPFDTCWIDAGWYEPLRSTTRADQAADWQKVGDWTVNKFYHPDGYKDVVKYLNEHNVRFMVWFEPERMKKSVKAFTKYLDDGDLDADTKLVALNDDSACDDVIETISRNIREVGISVYRQDFNMAPLPYWQYNDSIQPDGEATRAGSTEIHYINNLYRFWDALLERFPDLLIDDCAGGGHRIDIEMLSRSVPLWRSDYQCTWHADPEANQNMNAWASYWYPYTGIGYGPFIGDTYAFRSAWTNGLTVRAWEHVDPEFEFSPENQPIEWAKKNFDQFNSLRRYYAEDFYPLIAPNAGKDTWIASQYDCPGDGTGMVIAFRRPECIYSSADVSLRGLDENATYEFKDEDTGEMFVLTGKETKNLTLTIANRRDTKLLTYRKK